MARIADVTREIFSRVDETAKSKAVALDTNLQAESVFADRTALEQILFNLIENALRHTSAGGRITVQTARVEKGVSLIVRDTGSGIPAEHLPRIFERFYRVDAGRSRESGGTGLGLAIVRHLVEAHDGNVTAESTIGTGTSIRIFFPDPGSAAQSRQILYVRCEKL